MGQLRDILTASPRTGSVAALVALLSISAACAPHYPFIWVDELAAGRGMADAYRIQPGDRISVLVKNQQPLSGDFEVRTNGAFLQPLAGEVVVAGLTPEAAAERVKAKLTGIVIDPVVELSVSIPRPVVVSVLGEVRTPGSFTVTVGEGLLGVLARAGGLTEFADRQGIYVLQRGPTPRRVRFKYETLVGGEEKSARFVLQDGDAVIVE